MVGKPALACAIVAAIFAILMETAAQPFDSPLDLRWNPPWALSLCEAAGDGCCAPDDEVGVQHCHNGLGCDIATNTCAACGGPGQPCCDGHYTGFSLRGYTGPLLDQTERIESCNRGASCDARLAQDGNWTGSRRCSACGTTMGGSCCAPDVRYALGRCTADAFTGNRLVCNDPSAGERGTCVACGQEAGQPACMERDACAHGLNEVDGVCKACGFAGLPTCDEGEPCLDGHSVPAPRSGAVCVSAGKENELCLPGRFCQYSDLTCNARNRCERCGGGGQACCAGAARACAEGDCANGRCPPTRRQRCEAYASRAVVQSREYFARECGEASDRWQTSYDNHLNWCLGPDGDIADREARARDGVLSLCRTINPLPDHRPPPQEACAASAIVEIEQCLNFDGSPSQYHDPNTTRIPGCGGDSESAEARAKVGAWAFNLVDEPTPGGCTYNVTVQAGCLCR